MDNNTAREIRKEFFAYRNGIVADKLRKAGDPHPVIMGCLLVDVMSITGRVREEINDDAHLQSLAQELWNDTNSRECHALEIDLLMSCMLIYHVDLVLELKDPVCIKDLTYYVILTSIFFSQHLGIKKFHLYRFFDNGGLRLFDYR